MLPSADIATQYECSNVGIAFPFEDDSLPHGFPAEAISDMCVVVPSHVGEEPRPVELGCLYVGPDVVSVTVLVGGVGALFASARRSSVEPYSPVEMTSAMDGVHGTVSFGSVANLPSGTCRDRIPVSESAIIRPVVGRLDRFVDDQRDSSVTGNIVMMVPDGMSVTISADPNGVTSYVRFNADETLQAKVATACARTERNNTQPVPVESLNGVRPDGAGRIVVLFTHGDDK